MESPLAVRVSLLFGNGLAALLTLAIVAYWLMPFVPEFADGVSWQAWWLIGIMVTFCIVCYNWFMSAEIRLKSQYHTDRPFLVIGTIIMTILIVLTLYLDMMSWFSPELMPSDNPLAMPTINLITFGLVVGLIWMFSVPKLVPAPAPSTTVVSVPVPTPVPALTKPTSAPLPSHKDDNLPDGLTLIKIVFGLIVAFVIIDRIKNKRK